MLPDMAHTKVPLDDYDAATAKLAQLHALLVSVTSDGFAAFQGMSPGLQHDLLWLARDLAEGACRRLGGWRGSARKRYPGPGRLMSWRCLRRSVWE